MSYIEYVAGDDSVRDARADLARTNGFTPQDLEQNRAGKISDSQWTRLLMRALEPVRYTGSALLGWLVCCFVVKTIVPGIVLWILSWLGVQGLGVLLGAVTLACVGAFLFSLFKSGRLMALLLLDLSGGQSACLEGRVSGGRHEEKGLGMARIHGENNVKHWYCIKDERFDVDEDAYNALNGMMLCKVYFTPRSKLLLSIEPK